MWKLLEKFLGSHEWYRRRIEQALGLERRGEVRKDGLQLGRMQHRLEIRWRARGIHPWDRHLSGDLRQARFIEQALCDTEAAIARLFEALPEVDMIDLCVTEPESDASILSGTVRRSDFQDVRPSLSVRMRLMDMGVTFEFCETDYRYRVGA